jgi:hypothetical protein
MSSSVRDIIGTPFQRGGDNQEGMDCAGVVTWYYRHIKNDPLDIELNYDESDASTDPDELQTFMIQCLRDHFEPIMVDDIQPSDLIVIDCPFTKIENHIAVFEGPYKIIHALKKCGVAREYLTKYDEYIQSCWRRKPLH